MLFQYTRIFFFLVLFVCLFLWLHSWHVEVTGPRNERVPRQWPKTLQWQLLILKPLHHKRELPLGFYEGDFFFFLTGCFLWVFTQVKAALPAALVQIKTQPSFSVPFFPASFFSLALITVDRDIHTFTLILLTIFQFLKL